MNTRHQSGQTRRRACDQGNGRGRPRVINAELFRSVLIGERKRSDRSNQSVVLLLLDMDDGLGAESSLIWDAAIEASRNSLRLNPSNHEARMLLIQGLLRNRRLPEARREFQTLLDHDPPGRDALQAWFVKTLSP